MNQYLQIPAYFFLFPEDEFSDIKFIFNKTKKWDSQRFYIESEFKLRDFFEPEDELSPNNTTYLFSGAANVVSNNEKKALANYALALASDTLNYEFKHLQKIAFNEEFEGMCLEISTPIYSSNNQFAFLDIYVHHNASKALYDSSTYYEKIGIILKKENNNWILLKKKRWLFL